MLLIKQFEVEIMIELAFQPRGGIMILRALCSPLPASSPFMETLPWDTDRERQHFAVHQSEANLSRLPLSATYKMFHLVSRYSALCRLLVTLLLTLLTKPLPPLSAILCLCTHQASSGNVLVSLNRTYPWDVFRLSCHSKTTHAFLWVVSFTKNVLESSISVSLCFAWILKR